MTLDSTLSDFDGHDCGGADADTVGKTSRTHAVDQLGVTIP